MPLTDGQHSELLAEYKNLIDFYFNRVKAIVATAEREDTERRMVITSVLERALPVIRPDVQRGRQRQAVRAVPEVPGRFASPFKISPL